MLKDREQCRACGCPIEFIYGPGGRSIPVQRVRTVYRYVENGERAALEKLTFRPGDDGHKPELYVSHFETCSDPQRFSRKR